MSYNSSLLNQGSTLKINMGDEIEYIRQEIDQIKKRTKEQLKELETEKEFWQSVANKESIEVINEHFQKYRNLIECNRSNAETEYESECSKAQDQVTELKKLASYQEDENTKVTVLNVEVSRLLQTLTDELDNYINRSQNQKLQIKKSSLKLSRSRENSHKENICNISDAVSKIDRLENKLNRLKGKITTAKNMQAQEEAKLAKAEKVITSLTQGIVELSQISSRPLPKVDDILENPELLTRIVDEANQKIYDEQREYNEERANKEYNLPDLSPQNKAAPLSKSVHSLLNKLGKQIIDMSKYYNNQEDNIL